MDKYYDYTVEMMRNYHGQTDAEFWKKIDFSIVSEELYIICRGEKKEVTDEVRESFRKAYKKYINAKMKEIGGKLKLAIVMFQGTYRRIIPRNSPRNGMSYIEDNVRQVVKQLPKLPKGERYVFPALKIIISENGVDFFVFPR